MCVCTYGYDDDDGPVCICVCVYACVYACVCMYVCVCMCVCIDGESTWSVWKLYATDWVYVSANKEMLVDVTSVCSIMIIKV